MRADFAACNSRMWRNPPQWLTAENAAYLTGGLTKTDLNAALSYEGFKDGQLQNAVEGTLENHVPAKATALYGNSELQRAAIQISNSLFNWQCYPSYYGSNEVIIPESSAITGKAEKKDASWFNGWGAFLERLDDCAKRYPSVDFIVYVVECNYTSSSLNPTYTLCSNVTSASEIRANIENMKEETCTSPNVELLWSEYSELDDYYKDFYRTDHHWNIRGALNAFYAIRDELQIDSMDFDGFRLLPNSLFSGSRARDGLVNQVEMVEDLAYPFSELNAEKYGDGSIVNASSHNAYQLSEPLRKKSDFYEVYYSDLENSCISGGTGEGELLLVGDSLASAITRPLALSCKTLDVSSALRGSQKNRTDFADLIQEKDIDAVVFVAHQDDYSTFDSKNPNFF